MNKQIRFDRFYMNLALSVAEFSYCVRKKVGAVLVKDDVIVIGYNGTISGEPNICEGPDGETLASVLHAESNALSKIMNSTLVSSGATMYCTLSPCINCAKLMIQAKIARFVYYNDHSDASGIELMIRSGILVEKFSSGL